MILIQEFCDHHSACGEGRDWALKHCTDMQDAWNKLKTDWLIWVATRRGVLTDKELRLFAVFCAKQVEHLLTDERSKNAIKVAERFANGEATKDELAAARDAASNAARYAARYAAWYASRYAAKYAAWAAARDAAKYAAWAAARDAAWYAARYATGKAQAAWLRANTKPNFNEVTE